MMENQKSLSASMEDYLETIWLIKQELGVVRVRDIARARDVALPSVNSALKNLSRLHLVKHDRYEFVELTSKGSQAAKRIYERHLILRQFLKEVLGVDKKTAEKDACKLEHSLSPESLERLTRFMDFIRTCPSEMKFGKKQKDLFLKNAKSRSGEKGNKRRHNSQGLKKDE